jgi:hypothetical protein
MEILREIQSFTLLWHDLDYIEIVRGDEDDAGWDDLKVLGAAVSLDINTSVKFVDK